MATKSQMIPVSANFNMDAFCEKLVDEYRAMGYNVVPSMSTNGQMRQITIEKDDEGIKNFLGLGIQETVTFNYSNGSLVATYEDGSQTMRFIALAVGWFLCLIPFITGLVGFSNHSSFLKKLQTSVMMNAGQF